MLLLNAAIFLKLSRRFLCNIPYPCSIRGTSEISNHPISKPAAQHAHAWNDTYLNSGEVCFDVWCSIPRTCCNGHFDKLIAKAVAKWPCIIYIDAPKRICQKIYTPHPHQMALVKHFASRNLSPPPTPPPNTLAKNASPEFHFLLTQNF